MGVFPLNSLSPELLLQVFSHLSGTNLYKLSFVCKTYHSLAKLAMLQHGREQINQVIVIQRWWRKLEGEALAYRKHKRQIAINDLMQTAESVAKGEKRSLECRRELLALIRKEKQEEKEKKTEKEKEKERKKKDQGKIASFVKRIPMVGSMIDRERIPLNPFTEEFVKTVLPKKFLKNLSAVFNRFYQRLVLMLEEWKNEDLPYDQCLSDILMDFLEHSREPLMGYLNYLHETRRQDDGIHPALELEYQLSHKVYQSSLKEYPQHWSIYESSMTRVSDVSRGCPLRGFLRGADRRSLHFGDITVTNSKYCSCFAWGRWFSRRLRREVTIWMESLKRRHPEYRIFHTKVMPLVTQYCADLEKLLAARPDI